MRSVKIGFIGQGFIGKNYADDFENRGYSVTRYSLEEKHLPNKDSIKLCDIVFIAVPTPTTPEGYVCDIVEESLYLVGDQKIAVIKSTMLPGTTTRLQEKFKNIYVLHSPEFLREVSAAYDAANPEKNIIGIPKDDPVIQEKANLVLSVLPKAKYSKICLSHEAELVKYATNNFLYTKVIYMNMIYDLAEKLGCEWNTIVDSLVADARIGASHMHPLHGTGRGAAGHCFIKDFAAFRDFYQKTLPEHDDTIDVLISLENKNKNLLRSTGKDLHLFTGVYGPLDL